MGTLLGIIVLIAICAYASHRKNYRLPYGTQARLDKMYPNDPYWRALEKKAMDVAYKDVPLTPIEQAAWDKHEGRK